MESPAALSRMLASPEMGSLCEAATSQRRPEQALSTVKLNNVAAEALRYFERKKLVTPANQLRLARIIQTIVREWFQLLDKDGGGAIHADELEEPLASAGIIRNRKELNTLVAAVDTDGSGMIEIDELFQVIHSALTGAAEGVSAPIGGFIANIQRERAEQTASMTLPTILTQYRRQLLRDGFQASEDTVRRQLENSQQPLLPQAESLLALERLQHERLVAESAQRHKSLAKAVKLLRRRDRGRKRPPPLPFEAAARVGVVKGLDAESSRQQSSSRDEFRRDSAASGSKQPSLEERRPSLPDVEPCPEQSSCHKIDLARLDLSLASDSVPPISVHRKTMRRLEAAAQAVLARRSSAQRTLMNQRTDVADYQDSQARCRHKPIAEVLRLGEPASKRAGLPPSPVSTRVDLYMRQQRENQLRKQRTMRRLQAKRDRGGRRSSVVLSRAAVGDSRVTALGSSFFLKSQQQRETIPVPVPPHLSPLLPHSSPIFEASPGLVALDHVGFRAHSSFDSLE
jgi:centrin-1